MSENIAERIAVPDVFYTRVMRSPVLEEEGRLFRPVCASAQMCGCVVIYLQFCLQCLPYPWKPRLASHKLCAKKQWNKTKNQNRNSKPQCSKVLDWALFPAILGTELRAPSTPSKGPTTETRTRLSLTSANLLPERERELGSLTLPVSERLVLQSRHNPSCPKSKQRKRADNRKQDKSPDHAEGKGRPTCKGGVCFPKVIVCDNSHCSVDFQIRETHPGVEKYSK